MTTNRWFRLAMLLSVFLIVPLSGMVQQEKIRTPSEKMDELFDFWNRLDQPGFAVVVVKDGRVAYQKTFGLACLEQPAPNTSKTVFHVINLAMPVTAMAVAMLEKQGKLSLDDDVRKYIPEVPDFGLPIKLRHLLYHSSGLRDWISVLALMGTDKEEVTFNRILSAVKTPKAAGVESRRPIPVLQHQLRPVGGNGQTGHRQTAGRLDLGKYLQAFENDEDSFSRPLPGGHG